MTEHDMKPDFDVAERDPKLEDFVGKTVTGFNFDAANIWRFTFSDGSVIAIEAELHHGVPIMLICDRCADLSPEEQEETIGLWSHHLLAIGRLHKTGFDHDEAERPGGRYDESGEPADPGTPMDGSVGPVTASDQKE